jgi:predicted transcriptional regulator
VTVDERLARAEELYKRMEEIRARLETEDEPSIELLEQLAQLARAVQEEIEQAKREAENAQS